MSTTLSLLFRNDSGRSGAVCVYQRSPEIEAAGGQPVAWITKSVAPSTNVLVTWQAEFAFVWREAHELSPTIALQAWQAWPADPAGQNQITVRRNERFYTFADPSQAPQPGALVILTDENVAPGVLSIGIGTGGMVTFVSPAKPGTTHAFAPDATYWIAFGDYVTGQVLDPLTIVPQVQLLFSSLITRLAVVLDAGDVWTTNAF
jgi:rhizosphere induced protein